MTAQHSDALARRLTGTLSLDEFNRDVREKRAGYFANAIPPDDLRELFTLTRLDALFGDEAAIAPCVDIFDEQHLRRLADVQRKSGKTCLEVAIACLADGATIRVRDADRFDEPLSRFSSSVQRLFTAAAQINIYLTPPGRNGFPPHFDITDVFIIQCQGSKEWRLHPEYTNRVPLPLAETNWEPERYQPVGPAESYTLAAGDVLYLPRGAMHQAFCTARESLHLTVSIAPVTVADVLVNAIRRASWTDIELRRRLPWSDVVDDATPEAAMALRNALRNVVDQVDFNELLNSLHPLRPAPETPSPNGFTTVLAGLLESAGPTGENGLHPGSLDPRTSEEPS